MKFCPKCGCQIVNNNSVFCPRCGARIFSNPIVHGYMSPAFSNQSNRIYPISESSSTTSLVLGIIGTVLSVISTCIVPILFGILSITCGIIAIVLGVKYNNGIKMGIADIKGKSKATAGFVLGIIAVSMGVLLCIFGMIVGSVSNILNSYS